MTSREFCYWLQGFFELQPKVGDMQISHEQAVVIQNHLALVFKHEIDPSQGTPEHQAELQKIHDGSWLPHAGKTRPDGSLMRC